MTKKELRQEYRALRMALSEVETRALNTQLNRQIFELPIWNFTYYHVFLSIKKNREPDTKDLIKYLWENGKKVMASRSDFETHTMSHFLLEPNTQLAENAFGIPEPLQAMPVLAEKAEVVFVPLLAVDCLGNRLGYGKGFYDRFLHECKPGTLKIGLSWFDPAAPFDETAPHDVKLDYCVTPRQVVRF